MPLCGAAIFLSAADLDVRVKPEGRIGVVTRKELLADVQHHKFRREPSWHGDRSDRPVTHDVAQALGALGLRPRKGRAYAGSYELGTVLVDGEAYQDREATHRDRTLKTRARPKSMPVPKTGKGSTRLGGVVKTT